MAIKINYKDMSFCVGDKVRVTQAVQESVKSGKARRQNFDGTVIAIKGKDGHKTFTVRRIGIQQIGIEKIFPISSPTIKSIKVIRKGSKGIRRAKLYYTRKKTKREIEKVYTRALLKKD
jgi:large subunit ribosomal protein L19